MSDNVRFTAYLSPEEDKGLRQLSEEEATSMNYIVRCGVRMVLGLKIPKSMRSLISEANNGEDR